MRLFIAINMAEVFKDYFLELQALFKPLGIMSCPKRENMHLTLKFLGEVPDNYESEIKEALKKVNFKPFKLKTTQLGVFPNKKLIRVLWLGLEKTKELVDLKNNIDMALKKFRDDHAFEAHITLARVKFIREKQRFLELLEKTEIKELTKQTDSFSFYKSILTPQGPVYEEISEFRASL